ncbi:Uncharacterized protein TCM_002756 [Theobroma cacao]|uniref:Uncharacterized protein n=1 Tax=Theobroma cacao TaxID=3641 RepID=A0A061DP05_THECC|nr:Uncharacterized protein TCM_002756 [Theobroma cacao]
MGGSVKSLDAGTLESVYLSRWAPHLEFLVTVSPPVFVLLSLLCLFAFAPNFPLRKKWRRI